ncbi:MAG: hypothetical protein K2X81_15910, partial [Candidatus Obscuribacterales bacterium]|nr:hypothetical protein [Candidatus Obscuribacterales bacterium]
LAVHESAQAGCSPVEADKFPAWTDAHAAPIPSVLFEMLDQILTHPRLTNLKGMALEVDTKSEALIAEEFAGFSKRYTDQFRRVAADAGPACELGKVPIEKTPVSLATRKALEQDYERYALVLVGQAEPADVEWSRSPAWFEELDQYRLSYLPYEILQWGGKIEDMFPDVCRRLTERDVPLTQFLSFWFREPRPLGGIYDYFLLKIERFEEFIQEIAPDLRSMAEREASELRRAYQLANEPQVSVN